MTIDLSDLTRRGFAIVGAAVAATLFSIGSASSQGVARHSEEDAVAMVEAAIAHYDAVGEEQAFADFSNPEGAFVDGELYVIVCDMDGIYHTHAHNPVLIHNDVLWDIQDVNGDYPVRNIVGAAQSTPEGGWAEYVWVNPVNEALEQKRVYVVTHNDYAFAVGYYVAN